MSEKPCSKCKVNKPLGEFTRDKRRADGLKAYCRPCVSALNAAWRLAHPGYMDSYNAAYYTANSTRERERARAWHQQNAERSTAVSLAWRAANPDKFREVQDAFTAANPDYFRDAARRRRAIIKGDPEAERINRSAIGERDGWCCGICGNHVDPNLQHPDPQSPSLDHIIPLSRGGKHRGDNVQIAHLRCNISKGARVRDVAA